MSRPSGLPAAAVMGNHFPTAKAPDAGVSIESGAPNFFLLAGIPLSFRARMATKALHRRIRGLDAVGALQRFCKRMLCECIGIAGRLRKAGRISAAALNSEIGVRTDQNLTARPIRILFLNEL